MSRQSEKMKLYLTGYIDIALPPAPATALVAATNITALAQTVTMTTKQVNHAVNAVITLVDTTVTITGGTMTLVGRDQNGVPVSEVFTVTGAGTYTGSVAWSYLESVICAFTGTVDGGGDETIAVATGTKFGLPVGQDGELVEVLKDIHNNAIGTVGVYNRTYGTVIPASAPNGDHPQAFLYTFKVKLQ